jgi:hypothetical protein
VEYPSAPGISKEDYGAIMREDGLDINQMETKAKEFTLPGLGFRF